jgi:hypothetical protein
LARLRRDHGPDCCVDEHAIDLECGPSLQTLPPLLHLRVQVSDGTVAGTGPGEEHREEFGGLRQDLDLFAGRRVLDHDASLLDAALRTVPEITASLLLDAVAQMCDAGALDHRNGPLELHGRVAELGEQRRPPAQDDRYQLDADLVEQAGLQALPGHLPAVDDDVLVPGELLRPGHRILDAVG